MIKYVVEAIHPQAVELWDGKSMIDSSHIDLGKSTVLFPVNDPTKFTVGEEIEIWLVRRSPDPERVGVAVSLDFTP